ncbi:MAG: SpoIIE family protein phosphatase [Candidatus Eremiobacteraeota bacterium]|nr:SpoIIE family protein phosphatase [Candidatus Eremiobacteraeota bacterium]
MDRLLDSFHAFFDGLPVGVVLLDSHSRVQAVNPAYLELSGLAREEILERPCAAVHHAYLYGEAEQGCRCRAGHSASSSPVLSVDLCLTACPFQAEDGELARPTLVWMRHGNGSPKPYYRTYSRLEDGGLLLFLHPVEPLHDLVMKSREECSRLSLELSAAASLDRHLVPPRRDQSESLEYGICSLPYRPVGGDTAEVIARQHGLVFYVADVSGKSLPGAVVLPLLRQLLHESLELPESPSEVIGRCNSQLHRLLPSDLFVAATFLFFQNGLLEVVNAGQEPVQLRRRDGTMAQVERAGPVLGVFAETEFPAVPVELQAGDMVAIWSDGFGEALEAAGQNPADMLEWLDDKPLRAAVPGLVEGLNRHDDATLMVVRRVSPLLATVAES